MIAGHVSTGVLAVLALAYLLIYRHEFFTALERLGLGLMAAGTVMTLGPAISEHSPFDLWAGGLLRLGIVLFAVGFAKDPRKRR